MRAIKITNTITRRDQKSIEKYLTEISRYDVLTPEQELELFKEYKNGSEKAYLKLIQHNLRFVVSVAKQYQHVGIWLGDLINEGNIGLIKAARRFDETRGFKFISYAVWWIRQSIIQAINEKGKKIKVPQNVNTDTTKIKEKRVEFLQREEREPSMEEPSEATGFSIDHVNKCLVSYKKCSSIDAPISDDGYTPFSSLIESDLIDKPDHSLAVDESRRIGVKHLLRKLPSKQAMIIKSFYGLGGSEPKTLADIGDTLGLSRERVRQIKDRSLRRLRREKSAKTLLSV